MSKYIIRNCNVLYFNPDKTAICNDLMLECPCYCKERTDCVLKRIVDYCLDNEKYGDEYYTRPILKLLDIEEVE